MKIKQAIQIGDNVTNIIQLPCVQSAHKRSGKDRKVAYYILEPSAMFDSEHWQYAHPGDWLCETEEGKWIAMCDEEYQKFAKNENTENETIKSA